MEVDYEVIKGEIAEIEEKLDSKVSSFHKELTERIEEIESLQMLLEAEMLQLKEIITGTTDVFFPKELEKRVELIEEFISRQPDLSKFKDIERELKELKGADAARFLERVSAVEKELQAMRQEMAGLRERLSGVVSGDGLSVDMSVIEELKGKIEYLESLKKSLEYLMKESESLRQEFVKVDEELSKARNAALSAEQSAKRAEALVSRAETAAKSIESLMESRLEKVERLEGRVEARVSSLEAKVEELSKIVSLSSPPDVSRLEERTGKAIEKIERLEERVEKEIAEKLSSFEGLKKDVELLKKAVEDLTEEEMENRIALRIEESKFAKSIPILIERYRMVEDDIREIREELDAIRETGLGKEHVEKVRRLEERLEEMEKELSSKLELISEGHIAGIISKLREIDGKMAAIGPQWGRLESALQKAEEAKNAALSLRNEISVQAEAIVSKRIEQALSAFDRRITKAEMGVSKLEQQVSSLSAHLDSLSAMIPSLKETAERISEIERSVKEEKREIERLKREMVEEGERIKEEVGGEVDRKIVSYLKDFARKIDRALPGLATRHDIEELERKIEELSLPKKIDLTGITTRIERLESMMEEFRKEMEFRRQRRPFPFMIE